MRWQRERKEKRENTTHQRGGEGTPDCQPYTPHSQRTCPNMLDGKVGAAVEQEQQARRGERCCSCHASAGLSFNKWLKYKEPKKTADTFQWRKHHSLQIKCNCQQKTSKQQQKKKLTTPLLLTCLLVIITTEQTLPISFFGKRIRNHKKRHNKNGQWQTGSLGCFTWL